MCLVGALPWFRGLILFLAQMLGTTSAAAVCLVLLPGDLNVRTSLAGGTSSVQGLLIEMFLTAQLVFTIFMLAAEKHKGTFIAPVGIGLALFVAELTGKHTLDSNRTQAIPDIPTGVYFAGGSVNPASSFGPSAVTRTFHKYHWLYWVGPILGSLLASAFYKFIKMLEYETANPGQDAAKSAVDFDIEAARSHVGFTDNGYEDRPRMSSRMPPSAEEQYAGLQNGGMHEAELEHKSSALLQPPSTSAMKGGRDQQGNGTLGPGLSPEKMQPALAGRV
jgi:aquaporin related protein